MFRRVEWRNDLTERRLQEGRGYKKVKATTICRNAYIHVSNGLLPCFAWRLYMKSKVVAFAW